MPDRKKPTASELFAEISDIDIDDKIAQIKIKSKKTGKEFTLDYMNWAVVRDDLQRRYPDMTIEYREWEDEHKNARPFYLHGPGGLVHCTVTIKGIAKECWHPVMDASHEVIHDPDMRDITDAMQRAFVKCAGYHGYGLKLWFKGGMGSGGGGGGRSSKPAESFGTCPECGSAVTRKTNKKKGTTFYGCSGYPKCKWTANSPPKSGPAEQPEGESPADATCPECNRLLDPVELDKKDVPFRRCPGEDCSYDRDATPEEIKAYNS
jgi:hypothetical protein